MDTRKHYLYKRHCNQCGKYYEGRGQFYCSPECANASKDRAKHISLSCKGNPNMARQDNEGRFRKGQLPWNKGKQRPEFVAENNPNWRGGRFISRGYVFIRQPDHPFANQIGYVAEHRLVMEKELGRYLLPSERVHHKGTKYPMGSERDKQDNRPENLQLFPSESEHQKNCHRPVWLA